MFLVVVVGEDEMWSGGAFWERLLVAAMFASSRVTYTR